MGELGPWAAKLRRRYDAEVEERLGIDGRLGDVARYALVGGKRVRPLLAEAMGETVHATASVVTRVALAAEYLHGASLLLDDLPSMDHARERRGALPAHARFSEGDAILASIALVARSYELALGDASEPPLAGWTMAHGICDAILRMARGQSMELALEAGADASEVVSIHRQKTTALFLLAARLVSTAGGADGTTARSLEQFATAYGAAYQIGDDLEDREVEGEQRGNLACILGPGPARARAHEWLREARDAIAPLGGASARIAQCIDWLSESLEDPHRGG